MNRKGVAGLRVLFWAHAKTRSREDAKWDAGCVGGASTGASTSTSTSTGASTSTSASMGTGLKIGGVCCGGLCGVWGWICALHPRRLYLVGGEGGQAVVFS